MCVCTPVCYSSQDERVRIRFHCSLFKVVQHGPDEPTGAFRVHKMNSHRMCKHLDLALLLFLPRPLPTAARQRIRRTGVELELLDVDDPVPGWSTRFRRAARRLYHLPPLFASTGTPVTIAPRIDSRSEGDCGFDVEKSTGSRRCYCPVRKDVYTGSSVLPGL